MRFQDQAVIVTGAAEGIGRAIAQRFAAEGARVVIADINTDEGERVARELCDAGARAAFIPVDVREEHAIDQLVAETNDRFGPIQVAVAKCLAPHGIRVNCVSPGVIDTRIYTALEQQMGMAPGTFVDWLVDASVGSGQMLLARKGQPDEVAAAVAFLASRDASYITAQTLSVDGGMDWCW